MAESVEYNKTAINDARTMMEQILAAENRKVVLNAASRSSAFSHIERYANAYNSLEDNLRVLIQDTVQMLSDVLDAVEEAEK